MMALGRKILTVQALQLASLALPVIIHAWLARALGPHAFGRLTFVTALAAYWILLCDFGFSWSATRRVAVHRNDRQKCSEIVSTTLAARLLLFVVGGLIVSLMTATVAEFRSESWLIAVSCIGVLGTVLSPTWYFLGMERPHVPLWLDISSRALTMPTLVLLVSNSDDLLTAVCIITLGQLVAGIGGIMLLLNETRVSLTTPTFANIIATLRAGTPLFLSSSAVSLYTASSSLILGFTSTREQVGYFGLAQRLVAAACSILTPFNQVLYPQASRWIRSGLSETRRLIRTALLVQGGIGLLLSISVFVAAPTLILLLFGESYVAVIPALHWLAPLPLAIAIGSVFGHLLMLPAGKDVQHLVMTSLAGAINILFLFALADSGALGAAMALLAAECFVACYAIAIGTQVMLQISRASPEASKIG